MLVEDRPGQRGLVPAALLVAATLLLAACGGGEEPATDEADGGDAPAQEKVEYRVATAEGIGTPMTNAFDEFIDEVEKCTDGGLVGEHFPAQQLGSFGELIDGNRDGTYEITTGGFDAEAEIAPEIASLSLGYLIKDYEHANAVVEEMREELSGIMEEKTGVAIPAVGSEGFRHIVSKKPIRSLDELKGVKIRTPEFEIPIGYWRALGARAVPVPFAELYTALETGVVDAAENSLAQTLSLKFYEPARNLTLSRHWFNFKPIRVNAEWLNGLPEEYRTCISDVGQDVFTRERQTTQDLDAETIEQLKKLDVAVHEPSDLAEWESRAQEYTDRYLKKYPETQDVVDRVRALAESAG